MILSVSLLAEACLGFCHSRTKIELSCVLHSLIGHLENGWEPSLDPLAYGPAGSHEGPRMPVGSSEGSQPHSRGPIKPHTHSRDLFLHSPTPTSELRAGLDKH